MATNNRRKKKEIVTTTEKLKSQIGIEIPTHLSSMDLLKCETMSRDVVNARLLMSVEEQSLKNMLLEHTLLGLKIEKQKKLLHDKSVAYEGSKKLYASFVSEMWPRYGLIKNIDESIGYHDETGLIIKS
jgi:hypothetical protein